MSYFKFCHNLSFWVLSQFEFMICHNLSFVKFWDWFFSSSQLSFVIIWVFSQLEFYHNLSFVTIWVLSQFKFRQILSFVTIWVLSQFWVFGFCHNLSFRVWSQFEFKFCQSLGWVLSTSKFLSFITNWFFSSKFEFLSFITIWVFWVSSQFEF